MMENKTDNFDQQKAKQNENSITILACNNCFVSPHVDGTVTEGLSIRCPKCKKNTYNDYVNDAIAEWNEKNEL